MTSKRSSRSKPAYVNRLSKKMTKRFFSKMPGEPGIYTLYDKDGRILYVGHTANLRNKLRAYAGANSRITTAGMMRLLHQAVKIDYHTCDSLEEAVAQNKELIDQNRPPFNDLHIKAGIYLFIGFDASPDTLKFELVSDPDSITADEYYGAFHSRVEVINSYGALLRLLWMINERSSAISQIPVTLMREQPPVNWEVSWNKKWDEKERNRWMYRIRRYLKGTARSLIPSLRDTLDNGRHAPIHFMKPMIQNDLRQLDLFYHSTLHHHYQLARYFKISDAHIPSEELDEMHALYNKGV